MNEVIICFGVLMSGIVIGMAGAVPFYAMYQGARASLMD
jgi:hypothetical protein